MGFADHAEQGLVLGFAVDHPGSVEDLVATVFGVSLGEHHQLDIGRITPGLAEDIEQVINFIVGQRQAEAAIGRDQGGLATGQHIDRRQRLRLDMMEKLAAFGKAAEDRLGHPVMQQANDDFRFFRIQRPALFNHDAAGNDAFNPLNRWRQIAVKGNVGGL